MYLALIGMKVAGGKLVTSDVIALPTRGPMRLLRSFSSVLMARQQY